MGVERSEYVMIGLYLKELPFDYWADEYLRYIEGWAEETLSIIPISNITGEGYVIGRVLVQGDSYAGLELTEIDSDDLVMDSEVLKEIEEKLKISAVEEEIRLYAFSHWS